MVSLQKKFFIIAVLALTITVFSTYLIVRAEPAGPPPGNNAPAPINVTSATQTKSGSLTIGQNLTVGKTLSTGSGALLNTDGASYGLIVRLGTVGFGTLSPNTAYILDVAGKANATELCIVGDCKTAWPTGGTGPAGGDLAGTYPNPTIGLGKVITDRIADNAVTSAKISDGTIMNVDVNSSAAIAGTKINPDFGGQAIKTTQSLRVGNNDLAGFRVANISDSRYGVIISSTGRMIFDGPDVNPSYRLSLPNSSNAAIGMAIANAWKTYSSIRWKENIVPISSPLEKVLQLRGVEYDWKKEYGGTHDIGFVAEEVGKFIPSIVSYELDGVYATGLDYGRITPLLVEAIKEQQAQIEVLRNENYSLDLRIRALEEKLK